MQSRYYDPEIGRFLNADIVFDYDAGVQGYNLFVYCGNDPLNRIDVSGADSNKMDDGELTDDEMDSWGSGGGGPLWGVGTSGTSTGFAYAYNPMDAAYTYSVDLSQASNSSLYYGGMYFDGVTTCSYTGPEKTEVHHIVEQCQQNKSGFSNKDIQADSNKVSLPYSVHRKISGHYSSIQPYSDNMRVRNWLAGKSFDFQTQHGWYVISLYME